MFNPQKMTKSGSYLTTYFILDPMIKNTNNNVFKLHIINFLFYIIEEILEQSRAFWFSKNGNKLLFATFNATNVHEVTLEKAYNQNEEYCEPDFEAYENYEYPDEDNTKNTDYSNSESGYEEYNYDYYGEENYSSDKFPSNFGKCYNSYGTHKTLRYSKAGTVNSNVTLTVVKFETNEKFQVKRPVSLQKDDNWYFTSVKWLTDDIVSIIWMNRYFKSSRI